MMKLSVNITSTARFSILDQVNYLTPYYYGEESKAIECVEQALTLGIDKIKDCPVRPFCEDLLEQGCSAYRQLNVQGFKLLYKYQKGNDVADIVLVLKQGQDPEHALERYCLQWDR